ncbi:MAG: hypothetical protein COB53_11505 [Elusimicrobia bacterium]|nr:MAG: hypothetical protein COB53_11505 [Elusimicrobiota bacterium]
MGVAKIATLWLLGVFVVILHYQLMIRETVKSILPEFILDRLAAIKSRYFIKPKCFGVEITGNCNLRCAMCALPQMVRPKGIMKLEMFKSIVDQSVKYKMPIHNFHVFGDPLIYPQLEEAMKYFKAHGYGPGVLSTNGVLLNDERIDILVKNVRNVLIAMDSMDEKVYSVLRNNDKYHLLTENIDKLIKRSQGSDLKIQIQWLRTELNPNETIDPFVERFGEHDNVIFFGKTTIQYSGDAPDLRVEKTKIDVRTCYMPNENFSIGWDGLATFCCFDYDMKQGIGHVKDDNIHDIWYGPKAQQLRYELRKGIFDNLPTCKDCNGPFS